MAPIPQFPRFRELQISDRPAIEAITERFPPYSDFGFSSLWAWDTDETCAIALHGENLVVRFKDYTTDGHFYSFLGQHAVMETAAALLDHARGEGLPAQLRLIPESVIATDDRLGNHFAVVADVDNFDYIYAVADWASFPMPRFRRHRKRLERCREEASLEVRLIDPADPANQAAMIDLFYRWAEQTAALHDGSHQHELAALQRVFTLTAGDRLAACGFYDGERLAGFSLWESLPGSGYVVSHFQKADRAYGELSSWLAHTLGQCLMAGNHHLINAEQDLGIQGLRDYKRSLQPCQYLRKYVIAAPGELTDDHAIAA